MMNTTSTEPAQVFEVDPTNPGQFLACCGLLELAARAAPAASAWFSADGKRFYLACGTKDVIRRFLDAPVEADVTVAAPASDDGKLTDKSPPVLIPAFGLRLDWWCDTSAVRAGFKTWSGGQTVLGFIDGMRHGARDSLEIGPRLLTAAIPFKTPKPFYFDSRLSRLTSLDVGFSTDGFTTVFSPAVEVLALVGLQRFRPLTVEPRERYAFCTWTDPLPAGIAAAVAHGLVPTLVGTRYEFPLVVRTGGKYKAFGPAIPKRRNHGD